MIAQAALFALALAVADDGAQTPAADGGAGQPAAGASNEPLATKDVPPLVNKVFETPFPFCTNEEYPLTPEEHRWCALMPKDDKRCKALAPVCGHAATAKLQGHREPRREAQPWRMPVSPLSIRILLWGLLGVGLGFVIYLIVKHAVAQRPSVRESAADEPPTVVDHGEAAARLIETDVARLLESARAAAAAGDFRRAIDDAYAALLRKLEGAGVVRVEPHQTNGDHVRDVGKKLPALRPRVQAVVSTVEGVQFGGEQPAVTHFRSVLDGVVTLVAERMAALVPLVVTVALGALLSGCFDDNDREHWDRSPSGRAGVIELMNRYGFDARDRLLPVTKLDNKVSLVVMLPYFKPTKEDWEALGDAVAQGRSLIVAGGDRELPSWIGVKIVDDATKIDKLEVPEEQGDRLPRVDARIPSRHSVIVSAAGHGEPDDVAPIPLLVRGKSFYAMERSYEGGGRVVVLADELLFTNASLLVADNARLMIELANVAGTRVEFAGELTGLVSTSPVASLQRSRLAPPLVQLSLLVLLFFAYKGMHFGLPLAWLLTRRRAFAEHARAIGLQYARGRAARHALTVYGGYALERMRDRLRLSSGKGLGAIAEELAARSGRPLGEVMRVLLEAKPVDGPAAGAAAAANDLATVRDIATLLATTGGTGERIGAQTKA